MLNAGEAADAVWGSMYSRVVNTVETAALSQAWRDALSKLVLSHVLQRNLQTAHTVPVLGHFACKPCALQVLASSKLQHQLSKPKPSALRTHTHPEPLLYTVHLRQLQPKTTSPA